MSGEIIVDPHPDDVLSMAIRQRDAARAERDALREAVRKLHALFGAPDSHGVVHAVTTRKTLEATAQAIAAPELAALQADRDRLAELVRRYERITTAWTRGMYSAWIDCVRGDVKAAIECLSEGLDGYDGTEWNRTETGAEWWERTKAEEGL